LPDVWRRRECAACGCDLTFPHCRARFLEAQGCRGPPRADGSNLFSRSRRATRCAWAAGVLASSVLGRRGRRTRPYVPSTVAPDFAKLSAAGIPRWLSCPASGGRLGQVDSVEELSAVSQPRWRPRDERAASLNRAGYARSAETRRPRIVKGLQAGPGWPFDQNRTLGRERSGGRPSSRH
jgi:hypothetical protein